MTIEYQANHGFDERDLLQREKFAKVLDSTLANIVDGVVVLNANWGDGKSSFVNMWRGELDNSNVKYCHFDAYAFDYIADPFTVLFSELAPLFSDHSSQSVIKKAGDVVKAISRGALRVGLRVVLRDAADEVSEDVRAAFHGGDEKAIDEIVQGADWTARAIFKSVEEDKKATEVFRKALTKECEERKTLIIIDELDRCRPDYALEMLERIKHLFDVPGLTFLLVANLEQMRAAVSHRYGCDQRQAGLYLQKFYKVVVQLPKRKRFVGQNTSAAYFRHRWKTFDDVGLTIDTEILCAVFDFFDYSLRDVDHTVLLLRLVWEQLDTAFSAKLESPETLILICVGLKVARPDVFDDILRTRASEEELYEKLGIRSGYSGVDGSTYKAIRHAVAQLAYFSAFENEPASDRRERPGYIIELIRTIACVSFS